MFEVSYLVDVFEKTLFDTVYHEHLAYHSVKPLRDFFASIGMELIAAERVDSHGGSLRGTAQKAGGPRPVESSVAERIAHDAALGLDKSDTLRAFGARIDAVGAALNERLRGLKADGKSIAAFGAPAKATTLMYHFGIGPFNVFGPGMRETDYRVLPNFASRIKAGLPLNVYGSGDQTRTFCYITDAMVGFLLVVLKGVPGEAYNIGNPKPEISMIDLVKEIERVASSKVEYNIVEYPDSYPADEPNRRCPDIRKARLQLDYDPAVELDEGLKRFLDWADAVYTGEQ